MHKKGKKKLLFTIAQDTFIITKKPTKDKDKKKEKKASTDASGAPSPTTSRRQASSPRESDEKGSKKITRPARLLLNCAKSTSDQTKLVLMWRFQRGNTFERLFFYSAEQRERCYEMVHAAKSGINRPLSKQSVSVFIGTWNMGNAEPPRDLGAWIPIDAR